MTKTLTLYQILPVAPSSSGGMPPRERVLPSDVTVKAPPGVTATVEDFRNRTRMTLTFSPELQPNTRGVVEVQSKCGGTTSVNFVIGERSATEDKNK